MKITPEVLRKRFWEAKAEKEAVLAQSVELRADREKLLKKIQPLEAELREINQAIAAIERPQAAELSQEMANIARALGGQTGSGPAE